MTNNIFQDLAYFTHLYLHFASLDSRFSMDLEKIRKKTIVSFSKKYRNEFEDEEYSISDYLFDQMIAALSSTFDFHLSSEESKTKVTLWIDNQEVNDFNINTKLSHTEAVLYNHAFLISWWLNIGNHSFYDLSEEKGLFKVNKDFTNFRNSKIRNLFYTQRLFNENAFNQQTFDTEIAEFEKQNFSQIDFTLFQTSFLIILDNI